MERIINNSLFMKFFDTSSRKSVNLSRDVIRRRTMRRGRGRGGTRHMLVGTSSDGRKLYRFATEEEALQYPPDRSSSNSSKSKKSKKSKQSKQSKKSKKSKQSKKSKKSKK